MVTADAAGTAEHQTGGSATVAIDGLDADAAEVFAGVDWLTLPDVAERMGVLVTRVSQYVRERQLVVLRVDGVQRVPADLLDGDLPLKHLPGVLTLLSDGGYTDIEAARWLFTADESLPGRPIDALRQDRHKEVTRRAQAMAF